MSKFVHTCNKRNILILSGICSLLFVFYYVANNRSSIEPLIWRNNGDNESCITVKEMVSNLRQDDPRILNYIRKHHLTPPSKLPYNLDYPNETRWDGNGVSKEIERILKNKKNGFFIEAGGHTGESQSIALKFEKHDNWTGLCVEPSPLNLPVWKRKHRKAWLADVCLSPSPVPMVVDFFHNYKDSMGSQIGVKEDINTKPGDWIDFKISCFPIFSILKAIGVDSVDYFHLDVEGVEFEVVKTIPFNEILIRTISIEIHINDYPWRVKMMKEYLIAHGYTLEYESGADFVFVHVSVKEEEDE